MATMAASLVRLLLPATCRSRSIRTQSVRGSSPSLASLGSAWSSPPALTARPSTLFSKLAHWRYAGAASGEQHRQPLLACANGCCAAVVRSTRRKRFRVGADRGCVRFALLCSPSQPCTIQQCSAITTSVLQQQHSWQAVVPVLNVSRESLQASLGHLLPQGVTLAFVTLQVGAQAQSVV
eukprot:18100-Heterococcus_DN1.PRE.1